MSQPQVVPRYLGADVVGDMDADIVSQEFHPAHIMTSQGLSHFQHGDGSIDNVQWGTA